MLFCKKDILIFCILILGYCPCIAQKTDSLRKVYNDTKQPDTVRLKAIHTIAWSYIGKNPDSVIALAGQGLQLAQESKQKNFEGKALNIIGIAYTNKSNYNKAVEYYLKSLKIREKIGDKIGAGNVYNNLGNVYTDQAKNPQALECYFKALHLFEEIDYKQGVGNTYNNIGNVYNTQTMNQKALDYYFKALKIEEEIGDKIGAGNASNNIGNIYDSQSNYPKALAYYFKSLKTQQEADYQQGVGNAYSNIGNVYKKQALYPKALEYYFNSLKIREKIGDKQGLATSYLNLGGLYLQLTDYKKAIQYGDSSLQINKQIGDLDGQRLAYECLASAYEKTNNYKQAYENHIQFKQLTDSIFNAENSKQLGDLKTHFEVEKREAELKAAQDTKDAIDEQSKKYQKVLTAIGAFILLLVIVFSIQLYRRLKLTQKQKNIINDQKDLIEERHREITDSINYAERIQRSMLASDKILNENLKEHFVFFKPKDIVSGDFYWASKLANNHFALVTADSTGHGVPGAIMSMLNMNSLKEAIKENLTQPGDILNYTRKIIIDTLANDGSADGGKDGMDCSLCVFDFANKKLFVSAANNPVWIVRSQQVIEIKPDKMPLGKHDRQETPFTQHEIQLQNGDLIYTLTDGFPDQFGGEKGKKFMSKNLREFLAANAHLSMQEQKTLLENSFSQWMGNLQQVDDVTIIGIKL